VNQRILSVFLIAFLSFSAFSYADDENVNLDTPPVINTWGFDVGFGTQPYMKRVTRVGALSPFIFSGWKSDWRLSLDFVGKNLQAISKSINEFSLSLEANSKVYKDIAYSYVKFGLGAMDMDKKLYPNAIFIAPISLGLQVITHNTKKSVMSYFVEYRFIAYRNYDIKKSLPGQTGVGIDEDALFSGMTSMGIRVLF